MARRRVEKFDWYERNTFKHQHFKDIDRLIRLKEEQGQVISLCLPTMNEASTIGNILQMLKKKLLEERPLIDEICIIDGGSTDGTVEIAQECGVTVYLQDQVLKRLGKAQGKGEALWKSLYCTRGDIIVWLDSDIRNIHPRFVYGLVGPLLEYPYIHLVKAFYQRPLQSGQKRLRKTGGGRVTELVARPLLSLFYPQLTALIQPLSGEYAGRREVLEAIPFFTGYGVEIGMIIDIQNRFGIEAIAQVDLVERVHHNQTISALGRMSFGVMQAMLFRLQEDGKIDLKQPFKKEFTQVDYKDGEYFLEKRNIEVIERPPIREIKEYRKKFGLEGKDARP
jgi:glucosyl-3-phosphoglycerate synthase